MQMKVAKIVLAALGLALVLGCGGRKPKPNPPYHAAVERFARLTLFPFEPA